MKRLLAVLLTVAVSALVAPAAALAAPPPSPLVKQIKQGTGNGSGFSASLNKTPAPGNVVFIIVGLDAAGQVGVLEADDVNNVVHMTESWTAYRVPGAPYVITFGAAAAGVKTWGFHGVSQKVVWTAMELAGITTFNPSGVPIWDGPATSSNHLVTGVDTSMATGHRANTANPHELIFAVYASRVTSGTPPAVSGFANTYAQPGTWERLGSTVVTSGAGANHRLDIAVKEVAALGSFDATATWTAAPAGMSASLTGLYAN